MGRLRPSFSRSSSMSLAYAFSSSMSWTTSPGMSRGSVKTIIVAISSDGTATSSRVAKYRLSTSGPPERASRLARTRREMGGLGGHFGAPHLPIQPGGHQPPAVVVAQIGAVVLQRVVPHRDVHARRRLNVVLLLGQVALDVEDHLP